MSINPMDYEFSERCDVCGANTDEAEEKHVEYGHCSKECHQDYLNKTPNIPVIRPLYNFLCGELGTPQSISSENGVQTVTPWEPKDFESYWSRRIYKGTDCGAWLVLKDNKTLVLGSIVEGVDYGTENQELEWPFTKKEFWSALDDVEKEAKDIWNDTHGCEDCGTMSEFGDMDAINPGCKTCNGEGVMI